MQVAFFASIPLDISDFPTRHNYGLALWQSRIERILADWVEELAVPIYRGCEVTGFAQDAAGVDVALSDGRSLRAQYLVGCDGGRSLVRKQAGIDFPGWDASVSYLIAEAEMIGEPPTGLRRDDRGMHGIGRLEDGKRVRRGVESSSRSSAATSRPWTSFARRSSRCTEPTSAFTRHVALEVHRHDPAGGGVPRATRAARRRRGARAFARRAARDSTSACRTP